MSTATDEITARYNRIERAADAFGRSIGVKRLKPSQQMKVQGMTADLEGDSVSFDADGREMRIPHRVPATIAASVVEIDGHPIPFPKSRAELDAVMDRLDSEGIEAAATALTKLTSGDSEGGVEAAKNLQGTPSSDSSSGSSKTASRSMSPARSTTTNSPPTE